MLLPCGTLWTSPVLVSFSKKKLVFRIKLALLNATEHEGSLAVSLNRVTMSTVDDRDPRLDLLARRLRRVSFDCISASNLSQCPPTHFSTFSKLSRGKNPGIPFSLTYSAVDEVEGIFGVRF